MDPGDTGSSHKGLPSKGDQRIALEVMLDVTAVCVYALEVELEATKQMQAPSNEYFRVEKQLIEVKTVYEWCKRRLEVLKNERTKPVD